MRCRSGCLEGGAVAVAGMALAGGEGGRGRRLRAAALFHFLRGVFPTVQHRHSHPDGTGQTRPSQTSPRGGHSHPPGPGHMLPFVQFRSKTWPRPPQDCAEAGPLAICLPRWPMSVARDWLLATDTWMPGILSHSRRLPQAGRTPDPLPRAGHERGAAHNADFPVSFGGCRPQVE